MSPIKDQAELDAMRKRLYERGTPQEISPRTELSNHAPTVPEAWHDVPVPPQPLPGDPRPAVLTDPILNINQQSAPRKRYRLFVLLGALVVFLLVLGVTGIYMFMGNNQISGKNITVLMTGPLTVGGGEVLPLELSVTNNNQVAIESAVLIVNFPPGTKTNEENPRDLLEDRESIGKLNAGETLKIPVKGVVFGEENQEKQVKATVEYRLVGSSGTFYKEADPLTFKIISSPIVIRVNALEKVSSGQETNVTLTIQSNATAPLKDVIVTADYPNNFDFTSSEPSPAYGKNTWLIKELAPGKSATIKLRGAIVGQQAEKFQIKYSAGTAKPENQFIIGSALANATNEFLIEQPFINVGIGVNGNEGDVVTLKTGESTVVTVLVRNTLADTLYDMAVEVGIKGNVLVRDNVNVASGYYDSVKDVIRFEPSGDASLQQVAPGETKKFTFTLRPGTQKETPSFSLTANAYARRVSESSATEQLVGTANTNVKFTSTVAVHNELGRSTAAFVESGLIPPVADAATTYTIYLDAEAGGNDITGATLTTSLPQYVNWQNQTAGDGTVTFNPVSKEMLWTIGDIPAGSKKVMRFQVSLLPSQNQIGTIPAVLGTQRFRGTDRFTNEVVRVEGAPVSSELSTEAGYQKDNGRVVGAGALTPVQ